MAQSVDVSAEKHVKLVLDLGQHDGGYVDAYYGPAKWAEQSKDQANSIADIIIWAQKLQTLLPAVKKQKDEMEKLRVDYLQKQLSAVIAHARALSGEQKLTFDAQSLALYDT